MNTELFAGSSYLSVNLFCFILSQKNQLGWKNTLFNHQNRQQPMRISANLDAEASLSGTNVLNQLVLIRIFQNLYMHNLRQTGGTSLALLEGVEILGAIQIQVATASGSRPEGTFALPKNAPRQTLLSALVAQGLANLGLNQYEVQDNLKQPDILIS